MIRGSQDATDGLIVRFDMGNSRVLKLRRGKPGRAVTTGRPLLLAEREQPPIACTSAPSTPLAPHQEGALARRSRSGRRPPR